jgi:hypothetical protein
LSPKQLKADMSDEILGRVLESDAVRHKRGVAAGRSVDALRADAGPALKTFGWAATAVMTLAAVAMLIAMALGKT